MNGELVIAMIPIGICTITFLGIGFWQWNSKTPVGFWTGRKPPKPEEIRDIKAYNRLHSIAWIFYGAVMPVCMLIDPILMLIGVFVGMVLLFAAHWYAEKKYRN